MMPAAAYKTVPICDACWLASHEREPARFKEPKAETCYACGQETHSGIYVRRRIK